MTRYLAVTTCNAQQWERYGRQMASSYARYWPEVPLRIYAEGFEPDCGYRGFPILTYDLNKAASWLPMFKTLYADPKFRGMVNGKYNYRFDAVKFAHKVAAIGAAAEDVDRGENNPALAPFHDVLIWMDADVITHAQVTTEWLDRLLPLPATIAMIERAQKYPECGFMMFRLPAARKVIRQIVAMYRTGAIFDLEETHDSFVIGHVVRKAVMKGEAVVAPLAGRSLPKRHPFINSPLGSVMDHWKGTARKERQRSLPSDLVKPRPEPYWR